MKNTTTEKKYESIEKLEAIARSGGEFSTRVTILTKDDEELTLVVDVNDSWMVGCVRQFLDSTSPSISKMKDVPNQQRPFLHKRWKGLGQKVRDHDKSMPWYSFSEIMLNLATGSPDAKVLVDTFEVRGAFKHNYVDTLKAAKSAWCEAFGINFPTEEDLENSKAERKKFLVRQRTQALKLLQSGEEGVKEFNRQSRAQRQRLDLKKMDLKDRNLKGVSFNELTISRSDFSGSNFDNALFNWAKIDGCNFSSCTIHKAQFDHTNARSAKFHNTTFTDCLCVEIALKGASLANTVFKKVDLTCANLKGADLSKALFENCLFDKATFDEKTVFPDDFPYMDKLIWKGKGLDTRKLKAFQDGHASGKLDFQNFLERLQTNVDEGRYKNALSMLKEESFQLFSDVDDDSVTGIVLSQTNSSLLYSCRLTSGGQYACGTQNLKPCGGLRGAVCKHILVLVIGLAHAGKLDPNDADIWIRASQMQRPEMDKDLMTQTFLKYKSVEAGEVDWRPTETIPEDFYAY